MEHSTTADMYAGCAGNTVRSLGNGPYLSALEVCYKSMFTLPYLTLPYTAAGRKASVEYRHSGRGTESPLLRVRGL